MKPHHAAALALPLCAGLVAVATRQYGAPLILLSVWGCIIIFATHRRWPLFVGKECEDRWYTLLFTLNRRVITDFIGTNGLVVLNYIWGAFAIAVAVVGLCVLKIR